MATCEYEELRLKNLEDNKRILAELGLSNPFQLLPKVLKKGIKRPTDDETYQPRKKRVKVSAPVDLENCGSIRGSRRLSARLRGQDPGTECIADDDKLEEEHEKNRAKYRCVMPDRPNWYGEVPGVDVGTVWMMRIDCCRDGIHRPTVAGIHGGPEGAYSLALSGGYEDDIDLGDCFTYTGEGGRDLKGTKNNPKNLRTAPQSKDQELTRGNLALSKSVETGNPVRVIRGYKLRSPFAPDEGYRYDGLYTVEKFWYTKGLSGHKVYKFALQRCKDQAPPPWELASSTAVSPSKSSDSGFSDSANGDHESLEDKRSDAGDSGIMSTCENKKSSSDVRDDTKSSTGDSDSDSGVLSATDDKASNTNSDTKGTPGDGDSDSSGALSATGDETDNTNNDSDNTSCNTGDSGSSGALSATGDKTNKTNNNSDNTSSNTGGSDSSGALSATDDKTNTTTNDSDNSNTGDSDSSGALSATGDKTNTTNSGSNTIVNTVDTDRGSSDMSFTNNQNNDADEDSNVASDLGVCIKGSNSVSAAVEQGGIPDEDVGDSKTEADSASGSDNGMN